MLAARLAGTSGLTVTLSLAGRTAAPASQPVPVRVGGFGGVDGLATYLRGEGVDLLIDATHPFAARISQNAAQAAAQAGVAIIALRRPAWAKTEGDRWSEVDLVAQAPAALGDRPRRVFLAIGRQEAATFEAAPQHFYLVRSVDPVEPRPAFAHAEYMLARGPFELDAEIELFRAWGIDAVVAKNAGGEASRAKIEAARLLGIDVVMVRRPAVPDVPVVASVEDAVAHVAAFAKRGE